MSRRKDLSLDKHANPGSLQSADRKRHAVGTGGNEGVCGYEQLLDQYSGSGTSSEGEVVRGKVLKITATDVLVDVGFKSEGVIPLAEFLRPDGSVEVQGMRLMFSLSSQKTCRGELCCLAKRPNGSAPGTRSKRLFGIRDSSQVW
jgi:hypothetical protein